VKEHKMIIDEMQLVGRLGDVEPLPDEAFEQARTVLRAAIAVEGTQPVSELYRHPKRRRRAVIVRSGLAAGVAAALAAIVLLATSPGHSTKVPVATKPIATSPGPSTKVPVATKPIATSPGPSTTVPSPSRRVASPLVRLADYVSGSATPAGNAALVARRTTGGGKTVTVYDLYADSGKYYFSKTKSGLPGQVRAHHNLAGGLFAREVAAAKLAATGNVETAAQDMADAPDPSHVISPTQKVNRAAIVAKEAATGHKQGGGNLFDNWVWEDSQDAIIAGSGQPQVRAGVLRILATLPDVTVTPGESGGQSTLVLTAGTAEMGYGYTEQLTINATTGIPMSFAGGPPGQAPSGTVNYQVTRVTISDIAAGKL
jgi:hypothetical protein